MAVTSNTKGPRMDEPRVIKTILMLAGALAEVLSLPVEVVLAQADEVIPPSTEEDWALLRATLEQAQSEPPQGLWAASGNTLPA